MDSNLYEEKMYYEDGVPVSWVDYEGQDDMTEADADTKFSNQGVTTITTTSTRKEQWDTNDTQSQRPGDQSDKKYPEGPVIDDNSNIYANESAIEREIRLARERENELKREQQERLKSSSSSSPSSQNTTMPIHKVPEPVHVDDYRQGPPPPMSPIPTQQQGSMYKELPEVDRDTAILKRESIIEREIREQQERERSLREDGMYVTQDKEAEQSEFERREKENERDLIHESIVDREIRQQRERENEILYLRQTSTSGPPESTTTKQTIVTQVYQEEPRTATPTPKKKKVPTATLR